MPEAIIGAKTPDIIRQKMTPEGSLTVTRHGRDVLANTVGHIMAIPMNHMLYGTFRNIFENPSQTVAETLFDRWKDVPWKGHVLVRVGHTDVFGDLKRVWNADRLGGPFASKLTDNLLVKNLKHAMLLLSLPSVFFSTLQSKMLRSNYYSLVANSVNVYHPHIGFGMHEMGHADFFHHEKGKTAYAFLSSLPIIKSFTEYKATHRALLHATSDAERRTMLHILEPAWGTYLVRDALRLAALAVPTGLAVAMLQGMIPLTLGFGLLYTGVAGIAAGHIMNRLYPRKNERFGYIFQGKQTVNAQDLAPHQVLVARATAPNIANHTRSNSQRILF